MAIEFVCPACRDTLRVADDAAGRVVRCGSCLTTLRVPVPPDGGNPPPPDEPPPLPSPRPAAMPVSPPEPVRSRYEPDDDFGEPRPRRRRRRPPERTGRGPLFWVVVILLLLGFLTVAACGGLFLLLAQPHWRTHNSVRGGFQVEFPADAQPDIGNMGQGPPGPNVTVEGAILVGRMEVYTVSYADVELNRGMPVPDDVLANAVDHLKLDMPDATVVREQPIRVQNYPAREVVLTRADGESYICRIVLAGARVYVVGVGGPWVKPEGSDRTRRFFESFKVTNPPAAAPGIGRPNGNRPPRRKMPQPEED